MNIRDWKMHISLVFFLFITIIQITNAIGMGTPGGGQPGGGEVCGTACGSFIFIVIAIFVLNIALLVWVARDAKNRGMGSSVGWIFLILLTSIIGLIIYLFSRPSGELIYCEVCKNKRLKVANVCPHCGNASISIETKPVSVSKKKYCTNCGSELPQDALFCEQCGGKVER